MNKTKTVELTEEERELIYGSLLVEKWAIESRLNEFGNKRKGENHSIEMVALKISNHYKLQKKLLRLTVNLLKKLDN